MKDRDKKQGRKSGAHAEKKREDEDPQAPNTKRTPKVKVKSDEVKDRRFPEEKGKATNGPSAIKKRIRVPREDTGPFGRSAPTRQAGRSAPGRETSKDRSTAQDPREALQKAPGRSGRKGLFSALRKHDKDPETHGKKKSPVPYTNGHTEKERADQWVEQDKDRAARLRRYQDALERYKHRHGADPDRPVTEIPQVPPSVEELETKPIRKGISYVRTVYDHELRQHRYEVIEPRLTAKEQEVLPFLRETLYRTLDGRHDPTDLRDWRAFLDDSIEQAVVDHMILVDEVSKTRIKYYLFREFLGYGPVDALMQDPMIEDISCDGPGIPIYVFHRRLESVPTNIVFETDAPLDAFVVRLGQISGKQISLAEPLLDATLPDSSRLQATLSREVTTRGSSFTIRRFRSDPMTPPDLARLGTMSPEMAAFFWIAMEEGRSMIYAGGTASGKTTTLNAICQFIPPEKKIVSIEDTREINLRHENWIAGVSRAGHQEGGQSASGAIDMYRLLEAALRQRPEFLLVGEVRGAEAKTLFQAMATGHATYSTLHADSARSAVYRLENRPIDIPRIMLQTLDAFAVQVQARVGDRLVRRIKEVVEVVGIHPDSGDLIMNTVFKWDSARDRHEYMGSSHIVRQVMETHNLSEEGLHEEWGRRTRLLELMAEAKIRHIDDVSSVIRRYYRDQEAAFARLDELLERRDKEARTKQENKPLAAVSSGSGGGA